MFNCCDALTWSSAAPSPTLPSLVTAAPASRTVPAAFALQALAGRFLSLHCLIWMEAGPSRDDAGPRHDADGVQRGGQRWGSGRGRGGRQRGGRARQHAPSFDVITVPRSSVPNPASVPFIPEAAIFVPPSHRPRPAQPLADPAPQAETSGRGRSGRRSRGTAVPDGAGRTAGQTSTSEVPVVYPAGPRRRALNANAPPHIPADRPGASAAPPGGPADGRVEGTSEAAIFVPNDGASQRPGGNGEAEGRGRRKGRGGKEAGAAAGERALAPARQGRCSCFCPRH